MKDTTWIGEVLQDMAAFAVENDLSETYEALTKALAVATSETQQNQYHPSGTSGDVIPMLMRANVKISHP